MCGYVRRGMCGGMCGYVRVCAEYVRVNGSMCRLCAGMCGSMCVMGYVRGLGGGLGWWLGGLVLRWPSRIGGKLANSDASHKGGLLGSRSAPLRL